MTAGDMRFTLKSYYDAPGNQYGADLTKMTAAHQTTMYQVVVELGSES